MNCPKCFNKSKVKTSRNFKHKKTPNFIKAICLDKDGVYRYRQCIKCLHLFRTLEVLAQEVNAIDYLNINLLSDLDTYLTTPRTREALANAFCMTLATANGIVDILTKKKLIVRTFDDKYVKIRSVMR